MYKKLATLAPAPDHAGKIKNLPSPRIYLWIFDRYYGWRVLGTL